MHRKRIMTLIAALALLVGIVALPVLAATVPGGGGEIVLTSLGDRAYMPDGAIFESYNPLTPTGSGVFDAFLRVSKSKNEIVKGYNTDDRPLEFDENKSPQFTRAWKLSDVPLVPVEGETGFYREFQLDINQNKAKDPDWFISVDDIEIYLTDTDMATGYPFAGTADLRWQLDDGQDWWLKLDYRLAAGSGKRDLILWVPDSFFQDSSYGYCAYGEEPCDTYITFFSRFGGDEDIPIVHWANNDGFEEWGVAIYEPATKSGVKFHDLNADGVKDAGEPGLGGWTIYVDYDGLGTKDPGEPSAVTGADGSYAISGIVAGSFKVREIAPEAGWICSFPLDDDGKGCYHEETFEWGMSYPDNDFGNYKMATKSGVKFHDLNANGARDEGEPGLEGWTINATATGGSAVSASTTTGADGAYTLSLIPGSYTVSEVCPSAEWIQSMPAPTDGCGTGVYNITLTSGEVDADNDFGNYKMATKSGVKFEDLNADGDQDAGEPGLSGWTINATATGGSAVSDSTTTGADGSYSLSLIPGSYDVSEVCPDNWFQSEPTPIGDVCGTGVYPVNLTSGEVDADNDFGNYQQADLSVAKTGKITYIVTVTNNGPSEAINVDIDDTLPAELTWAENPDKTECTITGGNVLHCDIDSLADSASFSVTVEADVTASCPDPLLGNDASADSDIYDPNTGNNSDDADICPLP